VREQPVLLLTLASGLSELVKMSSEPSVLLWQPFKKLYIHIQADTTITHKDLLQKLDDESDALLLGLAFFKSPNERTNKIVAEKAIISSGSRKLGISHHYRKATAELSQLLVGLKQHAKRSCIITAP
jgi:hypothetical protein